MKWCVNNLSNQEVKKKMENCKYFGKELPSEHRCPPCPVAEECQRAFENGDIFSLTSPKILAIVTKIITEKHNVPGYQKSTTLGYRGNEGRIVLYRANDCQLVLRLENGTRLPVDSGQVMVYYHRWRIADDSVKNIESWLDKINLAK